MVKPKQKVKVGPRADKADRDSLPTLKLPLQWPMSTSRPSDSNSLEDSDIDMEADEENIHSNDDGVSFLRPGPCLQSCSGTDVQLSRGASARPNLEKGKGRFLIVLPGIMSLKPLQSAKTAKIKDANSPTQEDSIVPLTQDTEISSGDVSVSLTQESADQDNMTEKHLEDTKKPASAASKPPLPMLGRIEQLGTDAPVLKVPFGDGPVMVFAGKRVDTSSKFMMLSCKSSKKLVTCKDIFNSVIVFGEGAWQSSNGVSPQTTTTLETDDDGTTAFLKHCGESDRTLKGRENGISKIESRASVRKSLGVRRTSAVHEEVVLDDSEESGDEGIVLVKDSEDDYIAANDTDIRRVSGERRKTPRRSAASATVNYADTAESDDSEGRSTSDEDEEEEDRKLDGTNVTTSQKPSKSSKPERKSVTPRTTAASKQKELSPEDTEELKESTTDDEEVILVVDGGDACKKNGARRKRPRRSAAKASVSYVDSDESDSKQEEEEATSEEEDNKENEKVGLKDNDRKSANLQNKRLKRVTSTQERKETSVKEVVQIDTDGEESDSNESIKRKASSSAASSNSSSDDEEYDASDEDIRDMTKKRKRPSRGSASKWKVQYVDLAESEDSEDDASEGQKSGKPRVSAPSNGKGTKKSASSSQKPGSKVDGLEVTQDTPKLSSNGKPTKRNARSKATRELTSPLKSTGKLKVNGSEKKGEFPFCNDNGGAESPKTAVSPGVTSPHRKRYRFASPSSNKKSPKRRSPAKRKIDITNDDEFTFL